VLQVPRVLLVLRTPLVLRNTRAARTVRVPWVLLVAVVVAV
jgi:hypothetical protein